MRFKSFLSFILLVVFAVIMMDFGYRASDSLLGQIILEAIGEQESSQVIASNAKERMLAKENMDEPLEENFVISYTLADYLAWDSEHNFGLNGQGDNISDSASEYMGYLILVGQQLYDTGVSTINVPTSIEPQQFLSDLSRLMNCVVGFRIDVSGTELNSGEANRLNLKISYKEDKPQEISDGTSDTWRYPIESMVSAIVGLAKNEYETVSEQLLFINDYIAMNCEYDTESADNTDEADDSAWSAYGCLVENSAVCEGYTNAVTLILDKLGVPSIEVIGHTSSGQLHTWNKVYLDGEWLNLDVTSNSSRFDGTDSALAEVKLKSLRHRFFLISDEEMLNKGITSSNTDLMLSWLIKFGERETANVE